MCEAEPEGAVRVARAAAVQAERAVIRAATPIRVENVTPAEPLAPTDAQNTISELLSGLLLNPPADHSADLVQLL